LIVCFFVRGGLSAWVSSRSDNEREDVEDRKVSALFSTPVAVAPAVVAAPATPAAARVSSAKVPFLLLFVTWSVLLDDDPSL